VEQHIGGVGAVREVADFVHDDHSRMHIRRKRWVSSPARNGDERSSMSAAAGVNKHIEDLLNPRLLGDSDREVRLAATGLPVTISVQPSVTKSAESADADAIPIEIQHPWQ